MTCHLNKTQNEDRSCVPRIPVKWRAGRYNDFMSTSPTAGWPHPDELDALVAAPESHSLLFENEAVRVLETRVAAGGHVPLHTHRRPGMFTVLSTSDFVQKGPNGEVILDTRVSGNPLGGRTMWSEPLPPHSLDNVGDSEIHVIHVELKTGP